MSELQRDRRLRQVEQRAELGYPASIYGFWSGFHKALEDVRYLLGVVRAQQEENRRLREGVGGHKGFRVAGESVTDTVGEETSRLFAERDRLLDMLRRVRLEFLDGYVGLAPELERDLLKLLSGYGDEGRPGG